MSLAVSLQQVILWLLKLILQTFEILEKQKDAKIHLNNYQTALELATFFAENEFSISLLYIAKSEEKETHLKVVSTSKQLSEQVRHSNSFDPDPSR